MTTTVMFIPGVKASELYLGLNRRLWPSFRAADIERLALNPESEKLRALDFLEASGAFGFRKKPIYGPMLERLTAEGVNWTSFPFDWRFSIMDHIADLKSKIHWAVAQNGGPITLLCHSMGALLAKAYLVEEKDPMLYVNQVITLGAPWKGAPQALRVLKYGEMWPEDDLVSYWGAAVLQRSPSLPATPTLFAKIARTFPTAYQLLPQQSYFQTEGGYFTPGGASTPMNAFDTRAYVDQCRDFPKNAFSLYALPLHERLAKNWPNGIPNYVATGAPWHQIAERHWRPALLDAAGTK